MTCEDKSVNYLKKLLIDTVVLITLTCCVFLIDHLLPIFQRGFFCGDESLMLPYKEDTVTQQMLYGVGLSVPLLTILLMEWWHLRKDVDEVYIFKIRVPAWIHAAYCIQVSYGIGVCIIEIAGIIIKKTIGRLRPHFFVLCKPSIDCSATEWQGRYIDAHEFNCTTSPTQDQLENMRKSFLSGHSSWAAYSMIFTILYLERRKISSSYFGRHSVQFILLMLSWYTALSRISDYRHHWSDVLAGYIFGTILAVLMALWCLELIEKKTRSSPIQQLNEIATKQ